HDERASPLRETTSTSRTANGTALLHDRLAPTQPLPRPAETYRFHFPHGAAFDLLIEPHDAIVGEGTLATREATGWLATLPRAEGASTSAYAADPGWNVTIRRVDR
ncbi:MAG TPA: hypothetical protein VM582_07390, partial [Candidatus Thermoplasmatota archaeon]|nr:hypothetical protein [Candidatus Thermoplasmatota archaeon]